jgi:hypothetical protein
MQARGDLQMSASRTENLQERHLTGRILQSHAVRQQIQEVFLPENPDCLPYYSKDG